MFFSVILRPSQYSQAWLLFVSINKRQVIWWVLQQQHTQTEVLSEFKSILGRKMRCFGLVVIGLVVVLGGLPFSSNAGLDPFFYKKSCPQVHFIVFRVVEKVSRTDTRMPASFVRLFFHDCFVQVCKTYLLIHPPFLSNLSS